MNDLFRALKRTAVEGGYDELGEWIQQFLQGRLDRVQMEALTANLTIGETYFYRDPGVFEGLEKNILPDLMKRRRDTKRIRVWSAGCCTGEEPYSIAVSLLRTLPDPDSWGVEILGGDINPFYLRTAKEGVYGEWSFRNAPHWLKRDYFTSLPNERWRICPECREMVSFTYLNLAEDMAPSSCNENHAMDLIFCRNVLIYFSKQQIAKVVQRLHRCLVEGGWLVVSPCEGPLVGFVGFRPVPINGTTFYCKTEGRSPVIPSESGALEWMNPLQDWEPNPSLPGSSALGNRERLETQYAPETPHEISVLESAWERYNQGRHREAVELLKKDLEGSSPCMEAMALLSRSLANLGHWTEALEWANRMVETDILSTQSHYLRGIILLEMGEYRESLMSLKRTLCLDPEFVLAHFTLGHLSKALGWIKEAEKHYRNTGSLARRLPSDFSIPESDGMTAGRLVEIIEAYLENNQDRDFNGAMEP